MGFSRGASAGAGPLKSSFMISNTIRGLRSYLSLSAADWQHLLADLGLTPQQVEAEDRHLSLQAGFAAFEAAALRSANPILGIGYAHAFSLGGTGPLGFAVVSAKNVREALQTICRFIPMISSMRFCRYEEDDEKGSVVWQYPGPASTPRIQFVTWGVAVVISRIFGALPADWKPHAVHLSVPQPPDRSPFDIEFGPNLRFASDPNRLEVQAEFLDRPMPAANPRLFELMTRLAEIERQRLGICGSVFEAATRATLAQLLPQGLSTARDLAESMALSPAHLRKKLRQYDLDFRSLVDDIRKETARACLLERELSITEIAFRLGYSDSSIFTRACHKWFGQGPRDMRNSTLSY
jgi:AraC-like DNA-binding protein